MNGKKKTAPVSTRSQSAAATVPVTRPKTQGFAASGASVGPQPGFREPKVPTHEEIALAAYFRWRAGGSDAVSNWLAAEAELRARAR